MTDTTKPNLEDATLVPALKKRPAPETRLTPDAPASPPAPAQAAPVPSNSAVASIHCDRVKVINNVRRFIDKKGIEQLAVSIRNDGQLQPIVVYPLADGDFGITFGHRRHAAVALNASKFGGDGMVRCVVADAVNDGDLPFVQLAENLQREDMRDSETALALSSLKSERSLSAKEIADRVGLSDRQVRTYVAVGSAPEFLIGLLDAVEIAVKVKDKDGKAVVDAEGVVATEARQLPGLSLDKVALLAKHYADRAAAEAQFIKTPGYKPRAEKLTRSLAQQCAANEWTKQQLTQKIASKDTAASPENNDDAVRPAYRITKQVIHLDLTRVKTMTITERRVMAAALQDALVQLGPDVFASVEVRGA